MIRFLLTFLLSSVILIAKAQPACSGPGRAPGSAQSVCGSLTFTETDVSACSGPDLFTTSCTTDAVSTDNSRWYKFHCYQSGNFGFLITPTSSADDYDWSVLDVTGHVPADVYTMNLVISLNLSAITGITGCTATGTLDTHCAGGAAGSQFNRMLNLVAGHDYFLMVTNWSNSGQPYTINFSGTAVLTNNTAPTVADVSIVNCDPSKIKVTFSEDILCSTISLTGAGFTFSGGPQVITGVASDCQIGANSVSSLIINLQTPLAAGPYTLNIQNGTFQNTCLIPIAAASIPFTVPALSGPAVTSPISYCQNATATTLTATGTNLLWYTTATGGTGNPTAPVPVTTTPGTTIYYVSQISGSCESPRSAITVNVNSSPAAPGVTTLVPYCQNATAIPLAATGTNMLWYTAATGGTASTTAPTPVTTTAGTTTYYVSQSTGLCESPRAAITVDVTATPATPTVSTPVTYCQGATAIPLTATFTGDDIWYTIPTGGTGNTNAPTPSTATTGNTTYYVSQIINGCEGPRAIITVNVVTAPAAPTATSPISYCQNSTATALTATGTNLLWYTVAAGGTGSAAAPVPITTIAGTTIYYVSQTTGTCESPRAAVTVNVNPSPAAPVAATPVPYCQNATAIPLTATGTNLLWYTAITGGIGSTVAPAPVTTIPGSTTYYVSQSTGLCEGPRAAITVDVTATPAAPTVTTPITYCQGSTAVPLTATFTGDDIWFTTPTGSAGNTNAPTPSTAATGSTTYYVSQVINGCEGPRAAITVIVAAAPAAPAATSPVAYCQNTTAIPLTATGINLLWYTTITGGTGTAAAPAPITTTAGTTTYYVTQTTGTCESPRTPITVDIIATPTAAVSTTATSCPVVNDGTMTATPAGTGSYAYTIDAVPVNTSGAASGTFTQLPAGTYTITFTGGPNSCTGSITGTIAQGSALSSVFFTVNPNCAGINDGHFTLTPTTGTAPYSYTIDAIPTNTTGAITGAFTNLAPGVYTITFTDANGCTGSNTATITGRLPLTTPEAHTDVKCFGNADGTITLTPAGGVAPYTYALLPSTTFQVNSSFTALAAGSYTIRVKDFLGCTKDTTILIAQPVQLTASAVKDNDATCEGNDGGMTVTASGGTAPYQYSIDNGVTYQATGIFTNAAANTIYSGNIKVKDANGCIAIANSVAVGQQNNLTLDILTTADTTICQGSNITFAPVTNAPAGSIFAWASTTPVVPATTITNGTTLTASVAPADTAIYHLVVSYKTCTVADDAKVNVIWKPIVKMNLHADNVCRGDSILLSANIVHTSGPVDSLAWTPTDSITNPGALQTMVHPVRTTYYYLTAYTDLTDYGCVFNSYDSIKVIVPQQVIASAGRDTIAEKGQPHQLLGSGGVSYTWLSPTAAISNPLAQNPFVTLNNDASFSVIVKNATGCADTASVFVKVLEGPAYYIPNAFSPNGDGLNDVFRAIPAGMANTQYFKVMNRYGETVFETNQYLKGWDGTFKGKKQPVGVYVWIVKGQDKDGKIVEMKGTVMLVQ